MRRAFGFILLMSACQTAAPVPVPALTAPPEPPAAAAPVARLPLPPGFDAELMDEKVNPCDDFYRYACGGWLAKTTIPPERSEWSRGFAEMDERNLQVLKDLLEMLASGKEPQGTAYGKKLGDFYATCMDEPKLEQVLPELQQKLKSLWAVRDGRSAAVQVGELHAAALRSLFRLSSGQDFEDATQVIAFLDQGGLSLPDRDYYLKDDDKTKQTRALLRTHVQNTFQLLGDDVKTAAARADRILAFETLLAKDSMDLVQRREPKNLHHRMDRKALKALAPLFPWDRYLARVGLANAKAFNVTHPSFFQGLNARLKDTPAKTWQDYLVWQYVSSVFEALPRRFQEERFRFQSLALTGSKEDWPRWKRCVRAADENLGEALARPFVARTFGQDAKPRALEMVGLIEAVMREDLEGLAWMDAATREHALLKLGRIDNKIGFPDHWRSYDALQISRGSHLANLLRAGAFERAWDSHKIGRPLDRNLWEITPPTVNAYYEPPRNEIVFPAGILQPPFFSRNAPAAMSFGAIGMVVGHEATHGFDDEGRHYDEQGNLRDWWSASSDAAFRERAACVKERYDHEVVLGDLHLNGALTLGENVADMGGLKLAHAAYRKYLQAHPEPGGYRFNAEQQFFLGFAQAWCEKTREERQRFLVNVDPHSPPAQRINVPLSNMAEFQEAFQCKAGQPMVSAKRCGVW